MGLTILSYSIKNIAFVIKKLQEKNIDAVIIGDTSIQLALGHSVFEGDLDLFVISHSPIADKEVFEKLAEEAGWEISTTELGTPSLVVPVERGNLIVELYENYMDVEIPIEILEDTIEYRIEGVKVKAIRPEYYIVLKARQGIDLDKLGRYIRELKQRD